MNKIIHLSVATKDTPTFMDVVQCATAPDITFIIDDYTPKSGSTATLYIKKADSEVYDTCSISGNEITYTPTENSFDVVGRCVAQLEITETENTIISFRLFVTVEKNILIESNMYNTSDYKALMEMREKINLNTARLDNFVKNSSLEGVSIKEYEFVIEKDDWITRSTGHSYFYRYEFVIFDLPEGSFLLNDISAYQDSYDEWQEKDDGVVRSSNGKVDSSGELRGTIYWRDVYFNDASEMPPVDDHYWEDMGDKAGPVRLTVFVVVPSIDTNEELLDIRTGYNGYIYDNAGDAVRSQIANLNKNVFNNNSYDFVNDFKKKNGTWNGITFFWFDSIEYPSIKENICQVTGTSTKLSFSNLFASGTELPSGMVAGGKYYVEYNADKVKLEIIDFSGGSTQSIILSATSANRWITIPESCTGLVIRIAVDSGLTVDESVTVNIATTYSNAYLANEIDNGLAPFIKVLSSFDYTDANDIDKNCAFFVSISGGITNLSNVPYAGLLITVLTGPSIRTQILYKYGAPNKSIYRVRQLNGEWTDWVDSDSEFERKITNDLVKNNKSNGIIYADKNERTHSGLTYKWVSDDSISVTGTSTGTGWNYIYNKDVMPDWFKPGNTYIIKTTTSNPENTKVRFQAWDYSGGVVGDLLLNMPAKGLAVFKVPDISGLLCRVSVSGENVEVDEVVTISIIDSTNEFNKGSILAYSQEPDCNDIVNDGLFFISVQEGVPNASNYAFKGAGWLYVRSIAGVSTTGVLQIAYPWTENESVKYPKFRVMKFGVWTPWKDFGSTESKAIQSDTYYNTYNITTSPQITTDTNGWLQAVDTDTKDETGKTDMTGPIMSMLNETGYCHLGEGIFYISGNIDMPYNATLEGCGSNTIIRLLSNVDSGYCVRVGRNNTVKNIRFSGGYDPFDANVSPDIGGRSGIYFIANKDGQEQPLPSVTPCIITECWFENFNGSAVYAHNTGGGMAEALMVSDSRITNCEAGINIDYYSEYGKYLNLVVNRCYYACINNGGNNVFNGCTFHGVIGFLMDNTDGDKRNAAHGTMIGCTLNHIDNINQSSTLGGGDAIKVINNANGFIFTGCQIWYGFINIRESRGMAFSNCLLGDGQQKPHITVEGSYPAFFNGCIFHQQPVLNVNSETVFDNCYLDSDGSRVTP